MTFEEFVQAYPGLRSSSHSERIKAFGWFMHEYDRRERFDAAALRACYGRAHFQLPSNFSPYLLALAKGRAPSLIRDSGGFRLEASARAAIAERCGDVVKTQTIGRLLADLPKQVRIGTERAFIEEAVLCIRAGANRAAIIMTWNVAFDHLLNWLMADGLRLGAFNTRIPIRFPKRAGVVINDKKDFEEFKESEVIDIASSAGLIDRNIQRVLQEKLTRRNLAAHPTALVFTQAQAEDVVSDLVNNVILAF